MPWATLIMRGQGSLTGNLALLRVQLTCAAILMFRFTLAWYRIRFLLERVTRLHLHELAHTDPLTGLLNRRALYPAVQTLLLGSRASGSIILLDLDHFKRINDTYGHSMGDDVLVQAARLLSSALRTHDLVGRWGGEEFLIILPATDIHEAAGIAERLRSLLEDSDELPLGQVTASLGIAACQLGDTLRRLTARADTAMYAAKQQGRNCVVAAPPSADAPMVLVPATPTEPING